MEKRISSGWSFPVGIDSRTGKIKTTDLKEDIRQSILILLHTIPGERLLHKDYGCNLVQFMFEPITYELLKAIREEVLGSILKWEKRVQNVQVDILNDTQEESNIVIHIRYIIPQIMGVDNLNYSYHLK